MNHLTLRAWSVVCLSLMVPAFSLAQAAPGATETPGSGSAIPADGSSTVDVPEAAPVDGPVSSAQAQAVVDDQAAAAEPAPVTAEAEAMMPAPAEEEAMELSAEELEALGFSANEEAPAVDTDLRIYGFVDFTALMGLSPSGSNWYGLYLPNHPSFAVGSFNLYLSKNLTEDVRAMGEIRFTYLPNGAVDDYNDFSQEIRYGAIEIERVYLDWAIHRYLSLRVGQFLTAYGVWNVDHGSPTIVPVSRPFILGANMIPERQTGLELFGRVDVGADDTIGYHLALSNGKGPLAAYRDWDDNKAVSGRLYWQHRGLGELKIGVSGYFGKNTDAELVPGFTDGVLTFNEQINLQTKTLALAADIQWKLDGLLLQVEGITEQLQATSKGAVRGTNRFTGGTDFPAIETFSWGGYVLAGYRFEWLGVMPYALLQYIDWIGVDGLRTVTVMPIVGLNVRPIDPVVVKLEYSHSMFPDGHFVSDDDVQLLQLQVAWAF